MTERRAVALARRILVAFLWMTVLAGFAGLAAAVVRPVDFWPLAVLGILLPGVCIVLLASLPVSYFLRAWIPLGAAVVIVVMTAWRHVSVDRFSRPTASEFDLVLMSYNAPKDPDEDWARGQVTRLVAGVNPDLIALQESVVWVMKRSPERLRTHRKFQYVVDSLGYRVEMPPAGGPPGVRWMHWKPPVLLSFEPDDQEQVELDAPGGYDVDFSVLRTVATWRGRQFAVYNVHLSSHGASKPWRKPGRLYSPGAWLAYLHEIKRGFALREWQTESVRSLIEQEDLPVVLAGDFNSTPDSWTYSRLSRGLQDAFRLAGSGWGATYHARAPLVRIDFVLLGPEFEPVDAYIVDDYPKSSDHRPLVVRFRWR